MYPCNYPFTLLISWFADSWCSPRRAQEIWPEESTQEVPMVWHGVDLYFIQWLPCIKLIIPFLLLSLPTHSDLLRVKRWAPVATRQIYTMQYQKDNSMLLCVAITLRIWSSFLDNCIYLWSMCIKLCWWLLVLGAEVDRFVLWGIRCVHGLQCVSPDDCYSSIWLAHFGACTHFMINQRRALKITLRCLCRMLLA